MYVCQSGYVGRPQIFFCKIETALQFSTEISIICMRMRHVWQMCKGEILSSYRAPAQSQQQQQQQQQSPQFCTEKKWSVRLDNDGLIYFFLSNRVDSVLIFTRVIAWRKIIVHYLYIRLIYVSRRIDRADIVARCCTNIVLKNPKWIQYLWEVVRRKGGPMGVKTNFFRNFWFFRFYYYHF